MYTYIYICIYTHAYITPNSKSYNPGTLTPLTLNPKSRKLQATSGLAAARGAPDGSRDGHLELPSLAEAKRIFGFRGFRV